MAGNRVEELEAKVRELEATIDGLTDELVESKERLREVEGEVGIEPRALEGRTRRNEDMLEAKRNGGTGDEGASADDVNTDEADGEDNADSESGDDIIVA